MNVNIEKIKRRLLIKYPFFGSIIANTNFIEDRTCYSNGLPTAGTDGSNVYYHPEAVDNITEEEQLFLFAHEICHIAFNHILRSEGKNPELWNIATDGVINAFLCHDGLPFINGSVNIPEAINYDAEQLYEKLLKQENNRQNQNSNSQNKQLSDNSNSQHNQQQMPSSSDSKWQNSDNHSNEGKTSQQSNSDVGHDTHSMWQKSIDKKNQQPNYKQRKENIEQEVKKITKLGEKQAFKQNRTQRKKQLEKLRQSLAIQSYKAGNGSNENQRRIVDIGISKPLFDWIRLLKEAVRYDIDWSYRNASIEDGVVVSYLEEIPRPETEILLDTSGSVSKILLKNFLRECKNILRMSKIKVGCFDDEFYGFKEIRNENDIDNMEFVGGGGTNFNVAVNAFTKRVENKIIFTDGNAPMPDKTMDAIWVVFGGKKINPKGGKVINISEEQLKKLLASYNENYYCARSK